MNSDVHDVHCIFRNIGATGLVIFERDGVLLRRSFSDLTVGDVNNEIVKMLERLRNLNLRFGFISDQRGMDAGSYGLSDYAALTGVLDDLLRIDGAMPDFWMAWNPRAQSGTETLPQDDQQLKPDAGMILRAMQWYGVDKKGTVFVSSSSAGILAANQANIAGIRYSGWRSDKRMEAYRQASPSETTEVQRLGDSIERALGLDQRRTT